MTTDIEVHRPTYGELETLSTRIARTAVAPPHLRGKPDEVFAVMALAAEVGLPPVQSLSLIDFLNGRAVLNAQGKRAIILGAGHQVWTEERTPERAVVCGRRAGDERVHTATYTIEMARTANLTGKDNWKKHPAEMLVARATSVLAREAFADVIMGQAYEVDELDEGPPDSPLNDAASGPVPVSADFIAAVEAAWDRDGFTPDERAECVRNSTNLRTDVLAELMTNEVPLLRQMHKAIVARPGRLVEEVVEAEVVVEPTPTPHQGDAPTSGGDAESDSAASPPTNELPARPAGPAMTEAQRRKLNACLADAGLAMSAEGRATRLAFLSAMAGRTLETSNGLTKQETAVVIDALERVIAGAADFVLDADGNPVGIQERAF